MEVKINSSRVDNRTYKIGSDLRDVFRPLSKKLDGNYGGVMEHLWIDFELNEYFANTDGKPKFPFRFAKRVSGRSQLTGLNSPDSFNVGHFSVCPNFPYLLSLPKDEVALHCLNLIYKELDTLKSKEKKLGGFNSALFIQKFKEECNNLGYKVSSI